MLGVVLLAVIGNYLSALVGSKATAWIVPAAPLGLILALAWRGGWPLIVADLRPALRSSATVAVTCLLFLLSIARPQLLWRSYTGVGRLHPDLPWHMARAAVQAFQSSPGFWPLSPLAFPSPLPYVMFVADTLAATTLRYLPYRPQAFTYSQALFSWATVLWTAAALVAASGCWRSLVVLIVALLGVPLLLWGAGSVRSIVFVFFYANPNSLIAWPVALTLTFHLYRSYRRQARPSPLFLIAIPPASLFFKANQMTVFWFLQMTGFAIWLAFGRRRDALKGVVGAAGVWIVAILMSLTMGPWPASAHVQPAVSNLEYYARVVFPDEPTVAALLTRLVSGILWVVAIAAVAVCARVGLGASDRTIARAFREFVYVPAAVMVAALSFVMLGWWLIVPIGVAEGEPMHVNFELVMWLATAIIAAPWCALYEPDPERKQHGLIRLAAVCAGCIMVGLYGWQTWNLNHEFARPGNATDDYQFAREASIRRQLKASIPHGHCFGYGRRFVIDVAGADETDRVMAATGCSVLNGQRWRGYYGDSRPDEWRRHETIRVSSGAPFRVVRLPPEPQQSP